MGERELDWAGSRQEQVANSSEHGNSPSVFIKWGEFLEYEGTISDSTRICCMELLYTYCNENSRILFCPKIAKYWASLCLLNGTVNIVDFFVHSDTAPSGPGPPHYRGFTITLRNTTISRTPLDESSARRKDLYLTTHNTRKRQTSMPPARF